MDTKKQCRHRARLLLSELSPDTISTLSGSVRNSLAALIKQRGNPPVLGFYPWFSGEVLLLPLYEDLLSAGVPLYLPRTAASGEMTFAQVHSLSADLSPANDPHQPPPEPLPHCKPLDPALDPALKPDHDLPGILLAPGLLFTQSGQRLGRGRGAYDRFIAKNRPHLFVVGVCFECQLIESLPVDEWDEQVDLVVTEASTNEASLSAASP